jgi:putative membrane protein
MQIIAKRKSTTVLMVAASAIMACGAAGIATGQQPGIASPAQASPASPTTPAGLPSPAMQSPDSGQLSPQALDDQDFVKKALEGGAAEVELGQLAQQRSQSDDVKQFGQKMADDHTKMADQLMKPLATQLGVSEPKGLPKSDKEMLAKLERLSGPQFDEVYIKTMLKDHKQDLKDFKSEAEMTQNPNVKQAAQQGASVIAQHLQLIEQVAQNHNVPVDGKSKETSSLR